MWPDLLRWLFRALAAAMLGTVAVVAGPAHATEPAVLMVVSERSASYLEAATALEDDLVRGGLSHAEIGLVSAAEFAAATSTTPALPPALSPKLFVAVGTAAASLMMNRDSRVPLIVTLLPRSGFEYMVLTTGRKPSTQFSAVFLDQPMARQLDLIRLALPQARRIGVLWGPEPSSQTQWQGLALQQAAQARGLQLVTASVGLGESAFPALQRVLEEADVLLAVPNHQVYNSSSIQNILLASYRARVPLIGFSPAYVQAGAVFALHTTPAMIGRQTAAMARSVLQGKGQLVAPQHPQEFSVSVNAQVARSLGLTLDAAQLTERLRQLEVSP